MATLREAAWRGDVEMLRKCLRAGIRPDVTDDYGRTPLHLLCGPLHPQASSNTTAADEDRRAACFKLLRDAGANLEATNSSSWTPLHCAVCIGSVGLVSLLVQSGVNVDAATTGGTTALHFAVRMGPNNCLEVLLAAGASLNLREGHGLTPSLHYAARRGNTKIVSLLVEAGVDVDAKTPDEETALYLAVRHRATGCVEVLLAAGASPNLREGHRLTPFDLALRREYHRMWPLFLRAGAELPAAYPPDPYLGRVVAAGGFKRYAQAHLARIRPTFASMLRLPAQPARRVAEFWLHAGYY